MELQTYEKAHLQTLRLFLPECMVLLRNGGDFPLEAPCPLALYGGGARHTVKGGTGSGEVNSRYYVTVEEGLRQAGFTITTQDWLDGYDQVIARAKENFIREIKRRAKEKHTLALTEGMGLVMPEPDYELPLSGQGDAAVYVLSRISGEGNDRESVAGDILLSETEKRDILALQERYEKFLLVLNVGGPVDLTPIPQVRNILLLSQLGVETGGALADVLLGKAYPSGKLTTSWTAWEDACGIGEFGGMDDTRYLEGVYVGYRYLDSVGKKALFPFGYGLGYTTFSVKTLGVTLSGEEITAAVEVTNTGKFPGKETVQMYVSSPEGRLNQPYQALAGWVKTGELQPGQAEAYEIRCKMSDMASFDGELGAYVLEPGEYALRIGCASTDTKCQAAIVLGEAITVRTVENCLGTPGFEDWEPAEKLPSAPDGDCPRLILAPDAIATIRTDYAPAPQEIPPEIAGLTARQLAYLNVGAFDPKAGGLSIIGNASRSVCGAAGETYSGIPGIPAIIMADGPAGLRLSRDYFVDKKGKHAIGMALPETMAELMPGIAAWFMKQTAAKPKKGQEILHQYMTAIPIGTAIAQSWNLEFAALCGDIVGDEMQRTGVHLWLAPALNIHRSIRCGRNFEYYSEDPLISGKFAAAVTRGVQSHPGCGVTIKHYAANNQETNRYGSNSLVSQRALREIYLRGFGICVRESAPCAVMTSYNLLNGQHTSESRDLLEKVLRREYGFHGIVMTDWIVDAMFRKDDKYAHPNAARIAAAGGDLVMPGAKQNWEDILAAIQDGTLTMEQLRENAARVYAMAKRLAQ